MSTIRTGVHSADGTVGKAPGELPPGAGDELMQVILANLFAGVMLTRASDGTILFASPRFSTMFGYEYGELEGKPVSILNAPRTGPPEEVARRIIADLRSEGAWRGEASCVSASIGSSSIALSASLRTIARARSGGTGNRNFSTLGI